MLLCLHVAVGLQKLLGPNKQSLGLSWLGDTLMLCISQEKAADRVLQDPKLGNKALLAKGSPEHQQCAAACSPARGMSPLGPAHVELILHFLISTDGTASAKVKSSPTISIHSPVGEEGAYGNSRHVHAFSPHLHRQ